MVAQLLRLSSSEINSVLNHSVYSTELSLSSAASALCFSADCGVLGRRVRLQALPQLVHSQITSPVSVGVHRTTVNWELRCYTSIWREEFKPNCVSVQANRLRDTDGKQIISFPAAILRHRKTSKKKLAQTHKPLFALWQESFLSLHCEHSFQHAWVCTLSRKHSLELTDRLWKKLLFAEIHAIHLPAHRKCSTGRLPLTGTILCIYGQPCDLIRWGKTDRIKGSCAPRAQASAGHILTLPFPRAVWPGG